MSAATRLRRVGDRLFYSGYSGESLGLLRIWLGVVTIPYCLSQFSSLLKLDPFGAGFYYIEPIWYFDLLGIDHHVPWLTPVVTVALVVAGVLVALGRHTRIAIAVLLLAILYLKGVRDSIAGDVHHRLLIPFHMLFILLLSRSGDVLASDARRAPKRPLAEWEASWPIRAMQAYASFFYFFGAIAKIRVSGLVWFGGGRIQDVLISRSVGFDHAVTVWSFKRLGWELAQIPELCAFLGILTLVFEAGFPILFFWRNRIVRALFLAGAAVFHLANFALAGVQFLLLPLVFVVFFDLAALRDRWRARRALASRS